MRLLNTLAQIRRAYSSFSVCNALKTDSLGSSVEIKGWVKSVRNFKDTLFIDVSDGSTAHKIQITLPKAARPKKISSGCSVIAKGVLNQTPKGNLELVAENIQVVGECNISEGYPYSPNKVYTPEYLREHLHFRPRTSKCASLLRIRNEATFSLYEFFNSRGFINVHTPILTSNDCEGAGEIFKVQPANVATLKSMKRDGVLDDEIYFNNKCFLTVSAQLHLEAVAHSLSKVFTLGPTFRAENSRSRLHLSEFYMLEAEIAFVDNINELIDFIENLLKSVTASILRKSQDDIEINYKENTPDFSWIDKPFAVLHYDEAVRIIKKHHEEKFREAEGLSKEHEIFLVGHMGNVPTFVIEWPKQLKPFYMKESDADGCNVCALDLLVPTVGELVGGGVRENDYQKLRNKLPSGQKNLDWYLNLRKFGGVQTAGFGMGFERYLQFILGIQNIKDAIPFPRWPHNCSL